MPPSASKVEIVVEAGTTCNGDLSTALKIADAAKNSGADAIKWMLIGADHFMADKTVEYTYEWAGGITTENMYEMFKGLEFSVEDWRRLVAHCRGIGLPWYMTVDYLSGMDLAEDLRCPRYKLGSWDCRNFPLIRRMAQTGEPLVIDLGPPLEGEIVTMLHEIVKINSHPNLLFLHCSHALTRQEYNLATVSYLRERFGYPVGWSADSRETLPDLLAVAAGAVMVEKRLTLDKTQKGHHHLKALEPREFAKWVKIIRETETIMGEKEVRPSFNDLRQKSLYFTSIVAARDIHPGDIVTEKDVAAKRPGQGISPLYIDRFIGKKAARFMGMDSLVDWDDV